MGMDFCRNVSEPFVLQSDFPKEQTLPPDFSKAGNLSGSIDDLFPISDNPEEVDLSLEWLSIFVEECLSSTGNCNIPPPPPPPPPPPTTTTTTNHHHHQQQLALQRNNFTPKNPSIPPYKNIHNKTNQTITPSSLQEFSVPGKPRSKRKRATTTTTTLKAPTPKKTTLLFSDPPLLHQAYWLADSELIVPKKEPSNSCNGNCDSVTSNNASNSSSSSSVVVDGDDYADHEEEHGLEVGDKGVVVAVEEKENLGSSGSLDVSSNMVQPRRCSHCLAHKTPQWRAGPLGPKTLCNACGVRFKSGRLLPEYRPAKSPTFVSYKHSNSHKKVLEMRMSSVLSSVSTSE